MLRRFLLTVFTILIFSEFLSAQGILGSEFVGTASYYHYKFSGRKTASGDILSADAFTCAHRTFPFGTMLEITNLKNKKWCVVKVNDRGPYGKGRLLDVSYAAAKELGMISDGVAKLKVTVVGSKGNIEISRPEIMVENTGELIDVLEIKEPTQVPLTPIPPKVVKKVPKKTIAKKRKQRRK